MTPILGNGLFDTFVTGLGNLGAFGGIVFLYFIPPYLKEPKKLKKVAMLSIVLSIIYLIIRYKRTCNKRHAIWKNRL